MSSTARLGIFIFFGLIIFAAAIFLIGERQFLFSRTYQLNASFDNVAGLDSGAAVRAGGVRVGTVEEVRLPRQAGEKVLVTMKLDHATRDVIKKDSVASIETEGLLGNKYVAVSFGSKESAAVHNGDAIQSQPPLDYADLARKANEIMDTTKVAINNANEATGDLKSITSKIDRGEGTIGALINDPSAYRQINATAAAARETVAQAKVGVVSFQENMEALKHNFFLRGFFKRRGYFDSSELTAHTINKLPTQPPLKKFVYYTNDLFSKPDKADLKKEKALNQVGDYLEKIPFSQAVVVAYTGLKGEQKENLTLTQAQAMVVRQYLAGKFKIDDARIKTKGMGADAQTDMSKAGRVEIIVYPKAGESNLAGVSDATVGKK